MGEMGNNTHYISEEGSSNGAVWDGQDDEVVKMNEKVVIH